MAGKTALGRVMAKVRRGQKLTARDRAILSAARDAMCKRDPKSGTPLEKTMSKVRKGKRLKRKDRNIISAAVDAAKKSKRKRVKRS